MFPAGIVNRVNVQARGLWLSGELAKALHEFLLEVVCDVVLLPEENNAPLRHLKHVRR